MPVTEQQPIDYDSIRRADEIRGTNVNAMILENNPFALKLVETIREPANLPPPSPQLLAEAALAAAVADRAQIPRWYKPTSRFCG
jgi:hypothetical protein